MWPFSRKPKPVAEQLDAYATRYAFEHATRRLLMSTTLCDAEAFLATKYKTRVVQRHQFWPVPDPLQKVNVFICGDNSIRIETRDGAPLMTCYLNLICAVKLPPVELSPSEAMMYNEGEELVEILVAGEII